MNQFPLNYTHIRRNIIYFYLAARPDEVKQMMTEALTLIAARTLKIGSKLFQTYKPKCQTDLQSMEDRNCSRVSTNKILVDEKEQNTHRRGSNRLQVSHGFSHVFHGPLEVQILVEDLLSL